MNIPSVSHTMVKQIHIEVDEDLNQISTLLYISLDIRWKNLSLSVSVTGRDCFT